MLIQRVAIGSDVCYDCIVLKLVMTVTMVMLFDVAVNNMVMMLVMTLKIVLTLVMSFTGTVI